MSQASRHTASIPTEKHEADMKQVLQNLANGDTELADVPAPLPRRGQLLIQTQRSLISAGTERMLVEFGKANWLDKARQQPEKVKQVLEKVQTDGLAATIDAVRSKLDQPLALGYCNVGRVMEVGAGVSGWRAGDRVVSNGKHAEIVTSPVNLCARVPAEVDDETAAFTVIGAIGLQGIRLANPTLGECVVVTGLGLIGLLCVQMLRAQGCRVLGIDFDPDRLALAQSFGAEVANPAKGDDVLAIALAFSRGAGVDAVLITASTKSNEPVSQAAQMCRKRGRIVLVGVSGLELNRSDFYEKELTFQVSCSYGPGRYDRDYEENGHDYPIGFVRWTEQRNFEAVLDLMATGAIQTTPLISHRFDLDRAADAFSLLSAKTPSLGIILHYTPHTDDQPLTRTIELAPRKQQAKASLAVLGAGNYASRVLIPAFKAAGANLVTLVSASGVSAAHFARRHGFSAASSDEHAAIHDPDIDTVVIATQHSLHAGQVVAALEAGKHVFCEKPLCLTEAELRTIAGVAKARPQQTLMVGFNRRFSPLTQQLVTSLRRQATPCSIVMTINAGAIPPDHWTQDRARGGGRLIGEACHFIDLACHLAASSIARHHAFALGGPADVEIRDDKVMISLAFANGSTAAIHYLSNGHKSFPKERIEVFCGGVIWQLDNFRRLQGFGASGQTISLWRQDKGQTQCARAFVDAIRDGGPAPIALDEIIAVSLATIEIADQLQ